MSSITTKGSYMRKTFLSRYSVIAVSASLLCAAAIAADPATPAEWQKARHEHYERLGESFKGVRDLTRSDSPDWAALQKAVDEVNHASVNHGRWFPKGSGPEAGKTRALADIWNKPAEFEAAQKMFSERAAKLAAAAITKDVTAVRTSFRDVGGACKNCHDGFRAPE
jgi:cytochrome c556